MEALDVAARYFDAWNRRDPDAIAAVFVPDGSYTDPVVREGVGPAATGEYARGLFTGFPDLAFEIESAAECGPGTVAARWTMTGTNDGPFQGLPPSGRTVRLPGADFIAIEDDRVRSVVGYFDTRAVPEQIGLQVIVQPVAVGPFSFGTGMYVSKSGAEPGAVSLTVLEVRSEEERQEVRSFSRQVVQELLETPGFISWVSVNADGRMFTITAWEDVDAPASLRQSPAHTAAMERFFANPGISRGGQTGVWSPHRLNGMWVRCEACGAMTQPRDGRCRCGAEVSAPRYW